LNKISLQDLKKMYGDYQSGRYKPFKATKPGFAHVVNPTYKPPKGISPKQYEDQQKSFKMLAESKKQHKPFLYECPDCLKPMGKLGYCEVHRRWARVIANG
jgi:hypothetical protein